MSFLTTSLIFGIILFNYVPNFIFGYLDVRNLYAEHFHAFDGKHNWKLVKNNPELKGKSLEAQMYIQELNELKANHSEIKGAFLWTIEKNKEKDYDKLIQHGFSDEVGNNQMKVKQNWNLGPEFDQVWDSDVGTEFAQYIFEWLKNNKKYRSGFGDPMEKPMGITDWLEERYNDIIAESDSSFI